MEQIINIRAKEFKNYCIKNEKWLDTIELPIIKQYLKKETVIVELRELGHLYFIIRNTIRVLGDTWSHTIVCGNDNYKFILTIVERLNRNIKIIKLDKSNITRLDYSVMLLNSEFYKRFNGESILIYQEDSIIFRKIPDLYFKFDFIGAPIPNKYKLFNGGFSLRNKKQMIHICEKYYDIYKEKFYRCSKFLEDKINKGLDYKKNKDLYFLYLIEKSIIEDILLCEKSERLPLFNQANEFSVEAYFYNNPIGGHQFWLSVKNIEVWLDINLKNK